AVAVAVVAPVAVVAVVAVVPSDPEEGTESNTIGVTQLSPDPLGITMLGKLARGRNRDGR
ncbi:MAG TPA: hypothetical protein VFA32_22435, partial [Dehalococcoidia bacterium]|nr:hypothetical protein [Dehalococcoidia bacterium]